LEKLLSLVRFLLLRGTAESGALKANALPGGARRLAVRAVKAARFSRSSERSGRALTEEAGGPGARFQQEGQPWAIALERFKRARCTEKWRWSGVEKE
jgi:hypothetical protein